MLYCAGGAAAGADDGAGAVATAAGAGAAPAGGALPVPHGAAAGDRAALLDALHPAGRPQLRRGRLPHTPSAGNALSQHNTTSLPHNQLLHSINTNE